MTIGSMAEDTATFPLPSRRAMPGASTAIVAMAFGALAGVALWQRMQLGLTGPSPGETSTLYVSRLLQDHVAWNTYNYAASSHVPLHLLGFADALGTALGGGLFGARLLAALLGACSLGFVFGATKTLLGSRRVAAWTVLLLALQAPLIFLSRLATGDIVAFFFFTGAMWLFLEGMNRRYVGWLLCMLGSVSFSLSALSQYVVLLHAPAVVGIVAVRRPRLIFPTVLPSAVLLADYAHRHWGDLCILLRNQLTRLDSLPTSRLDVLLQLATFTAPLLALALAGLVMHLARTGTRWRSLRLHAFLLLLALPLPLLHLVASDTTGMAMHLVYPLLALAPLAAWFLHRLSRRGTSALAIPLALTAILAGLGIKQTTHLGQSYPDLRPVLDYLRPRIGLTTTVLSEEGFVLRYAFSDCPGKNFAELTYFDNDNDGKRTPQDVIDGVWDGKPDYVLTTGQVSPALVEKLRRGVLPHRYREVLRAGPVQLWRRNGVSRAPS